MIDASKSNVIGMPKILHRLGKFAHHLEEKDLLGMVRTGANAVKREVKLLAPKRTGKLAKSITTKKLHPKPGERSYIVRTADKKAHLIEFGTSPHTITVSPKNPMVIAGRFVSGTIQHPGTQPDPFMRRGLERASRGALQKMGRYIERRLKKKGVL